MTTSNITEDHKFFLVTFGCVACPGAQYRVRYGKVQTEVGDYLDIRPYDEPNRIFRIRKKDAYDTLDEAKHKALSLIESNTVTAKSVLDSSVQLLKFN